MSDGLTWFLSTSQLTRESEYNDYGLGRSMSNMLLLRTDMRINKCVTIKATKLIVVSAGAFGFPERLGIGELSILEKNNVPVLVDLHGVGENYQVHKQLLVVTCRGIDGPVPMDEPDIVYSDADVEAIATFYRDVAITTKHSIGICAMKPCKNCLGETVDKIMCHFVQHTHSSGKKYQVHLKQ
ncbi:hypothetical protein HD554DRAFT_2288808 [Boletus coccyginus]|nr:hypothetical protein HD554DRAFT_2288808 [Boletus coccyginus]